MPSSLPPGYQLRAPVAEDAEGAANVVMALNIADTGDPDFSVDELREEWQEINIADDARVVVAPDDRIAGYITMYDKAHVVLNADGYVHPDYAGRGIGATMLEWAEEWARARVGRAPEGARVVLRHGIIPTNLDARRLLESRDFTLVRTYYRMAIDLDAEPPAPAWPDGLAVRPFVLDQDERQTYEAKEEAMRDHWGQLPSAFERLVKQTTTSGFDPSLWLLAVDGQEIAGVALAENNPDKGFIRTVAVRRPWRGRGVATALLRQAFGEFYRRGHRRVELAVDSESLTGATRLYQRAGMHVAYEMAVFEKELRPGKDLSKQE